MDFLAETLLQNNLVTDKHHSSIHSTASQLQKSYLKVSHMKSDFNILKKSVLVLSLTTAFVKP